MSKSEEFFNEFYKHTVCDSTTGGYILLKDPALKMLDGIFEEWPFLRDALNEQNHYRTSISQDTFDLFFVPAIENRYK